MPGGFTAPGAKTVIRPRRRQSFHAILVPNQDPDDILETIFRLREKANTPGNRDQDQGLEQGTSLRSGH